MTRVRSRDLGPFEVEPKPADVYWFTARWFPTARMVEISTPDGTPCMLLDFEPPSPVAIVVPCVLFPDGMDRDCVLQPALVQAAIWMMTRDEELAGQAIRLHREVNNRRRPHRPWLDAWLAGISVLILFGLMTAVFGGGVEAWRDDLWGAVYFAVAFPVALLGLRVWRMWDMPRLHSSSEASR